MPQKTALTTSKRAAARGIGKDPAKSKINRPLILRHHEEARLALLAADDAQDRPGVCLVLSPRALLHDLQRAFELEFPELASRARFSLATE
jgi:hypothetical protein